VKSTRNNQSDRIFNAEKYIACHDVRVHFVTHSRCRLGHKVIFEVLQPERHRETDRRTNRQTHDLLWHRAVKIPGIALCCVTHCRQSWVTEYTDLHVILHEKFCRCTYRYYCTPFWKVGHRSHLVSRANAPV